MPDNFDFVPYKKIDIRHIRNELVATQFDRERKNYPLFFHIIFALISALCVYLAMNAAGLGLPPVAAMLGLFFGPSMLVYVFLYSPIAIKIFSVVIPAAVSAVSIAISQVNVIGMASQAFSYILCILTAALITKAVISGYTKTTCFVIVCAVYLLIMLSLGAFLMIYHFGTISPKLVAQTIDRFLDSVVKSTAEYASTPLGLEAFRYSLPDYASLSDEKFIEFITNTIRSALFTIKLCIPSIAIVSCMFFSFFTILAFSFVAKKMKINVFVCIMDDFWTYRPSTVTTAMYDIVFFLYIVANFIKLPQSISITLINLLFILTAAMSVVGINGIYCFFRKKNMSKNTCVVICAVITLATTLFVGLLGTLIIGSLGVMFVTSRDREETTILPLRILEHKKIYEELYKNSENTNPDTENNSQNNGDSI